MSVKLKPISQQTIVITGASSGIGLATAQAAAAQGAKVVLASRNEEVLARTADEIKAKGGQAIYVVADVSKREDIERLAAAAISEFGGFDTWVNDAGQGLWGRLQEVSDEDHRQLFDVNFWSIVYGSTTAIRQLKKTGGALINLGSVASDFAFPIQSMYAVTKHAIKGFTDALRRELIDEGAPVSVTLIQPAAIGTPFPEHAKNYTGQAPKLPPPIYVPEDVARTILFAAEHPRRALHVGGAGVMMSWFSKLMPGLVDASSSLLVKSQVKEQSAESRPDALWKAGDDGQVRGSQSSMRRSVHTALTVHPALKATLITAGVIAGAAALRKRS